MEEHSATVNTGLRGVSVASTRISNVDGKAGKLIYRGFLVKDLAEAATYEEVAHLLIYERLPEPEALEQFRLALARDRAVPDGLIAAMQALPANILPMDFLQAAVSLLAAYDTDLARPGLEAEQKRATRLVAQLGTLVAAWHRIRQGLAPVAPDPELSHAANFLYMLSGKRPEPDIARFFDVGLVLHAEHAFNASTFTARQVASTRAHLYAAVSAAVGSLSGELHGGANVRVMQMLKAIGSPENVEAYVNRILDEGQKIMGLGHAVYKVDDPRAHILAPMSQEVGRRTGQPRWYEISKLLEIKGKEAFKARKGLDIFVNVDFYSASLFYCMGIPVDLFTPVFAVSRVAGWSAHVLEERFALAAPKPALYRPGSDYVGDYCGPDECAYVPLDKR
jgi:citrate synthase